MELKFISYRIESAETTIFIDTKSVPSSSSKTEIVGRGQGHVITGTG